MRGCAHRVGWGARREVAPSGHVVRGMVRVDVARTSRTAEQQVVKRGIADPKKVGIYGLSDGSSTVQYAVINRPKMFAAASAACGSGAASASWVFRQYPSACGSAVLSVQLGPHTLRVKTDPDRRFRVGETRFLDLSPAHTHLYRDGRRVSGSGNA